MANLTEFILGRFGDTTTGDVQPQPSTQVEKPGIVPTGPHGAQMFEPVTNPIMPTATMPKPGLPTITVPNVSRPNSVKPPSAPRSAESIVSSPGALEPGSPLAPLAVGAGHFLDKAEETSVPKNYIPVRTDPGGDLRIRSGVSDPLQYEEYEHSLSLPPQKPRRNILTGEMYTPPNFISSPTNQLERMFLPPRPLAAPGQTLTEPQIIEAMLDTKKDYGKAYMTAAEIVNDVNTRFGNLRKWGLGDDPFTQEDDRALMITLPNGNTWRAPRNQEDQGHVTTYRSLADGTVLSDEQLVNDVTPINNGADGYRLPDGRVVDAMVVADPKFHHSSFPDGTIYMNADASLSPEVREAYTKQIGTDEMDVPIDEWDPKNAPDGGVMGGSGFLNLGVADPRAPWENERGDFIFESDYWDESPDGRSVLERSAIDEIAPWMLDMQLNSAPYYVPRYNLISGASAALPYLFGYDGESYMPEGSGLSKLGKLGEGTYRYDEMSNAQRVGGFLSPLVEAYVERAGGMIGGLGDIVLKGPLGNTRPGKWLKETPFGKLLTDALGEGAEELLTAPLDKLKTEGMRNYGRDYYLDNTTGELVFDGDTSTIDRIMSLGQDELKAGLSGAALGGATSLVTQGLSGGFRRNASIPEAPDIPRATPEELRQMEEEYNRRHAPTED